LTVVCFSNKRFCRFCTCHNLGGLPHLRVI
jgi:hypothetical protein